jgi:hypothetical protein
MIETDRRVYTPPLDAGDYAAPAEEGAVRRKFMVGALMAIVAAALSAAAWNIYGESVPPPLIAAETGDFKTIAPQASPPISPSHELDDAIEGDKPAAAHPPASDAKAAPLAPSAPAAAQAQGAFLAQLAALRTREEAEAVWRGFTARAPDLARGARMEIQRANLGAQGVYFRLRVGFFDTHERAGSFCARAGQAGQDCMVVSR